MDTYSTASSTHTSSSATPCQVYSPMPIRSPLALDICVNLSEDVFSAPEFDIYVKSSLTEPRPNKFLFKKLQQLTREDENSSDLSDYSFTDEQDHSAIQGLTDFFNYANFIRPPSRASNPQVHDEVFCRDSRNFFGLNKSQLEQNV